jgi:hypothetical protein
MKLTRRHWLLAAAAMVAGVAVAIALIALPFTGSVRAPVYGSSTSAPQVGAGTPPPQGSGQGTPEGSSGPATRTFLSLMQAQAIAERAVGGRTVEADLDQEPTGTAYDLKVVRPDGMTYKVVVDAATGRVLSSSVDD